jgi:histidinol dehydrogenase
MGIKIVAASDRDALERLYAGGWEAPADVARDVAAILAEVRSRGDDALVDYTRRFDFSGASATTLRVALPSLDAARAGIPPEVADGLALAHDRVTRFHEMQRPHDLEHRDADGTLSALLVRPFAAIGAYVPGGTARLPSTLIMSVVPAKIARVPRVVVVTPRRPDGSLDPAIVFAAALCGVDELYAVGGSQAIGALAFGTGTIARVDKIVGPGNVWVTEAKRQVFGLCGIDALAGPSEVLVVADDSAAPEFVAGELVAQAEHDPLARVAAVSEDRNLLERVAELLEGSFATECGRSAIVERVMRDGTFLIQAGSRNEILEVIDRFAPEHLSLQVRDPLPLVAQVRRAGAIFVGGQTPVASGDYLAGSNHILPTSGAARFSSGLRTADFYRTMSLIENSQRRMRHDAPILAALANFEGLPAHARTAQMRAGDGD